MTRVINRQKSGHAEASGSDYFKQRYSSQTRVGRIFCRNIEKTLAAGVDFPFFISLRFHERVQGETVK